MTKLSKDFYDYEFSCPCDKCEAKRQIMVKISPILVNELQSLRDEVGEPVDITSGVRCAEYNKKIGGYDKSPHLDGLAADIKVSYIFPGKLAYIASAINGIRIGIYPNHLHIDIVPPNPSKFWLVKKYGSKYIYSGSEKDLAKFLKDNL